MAVMTWRHCALQKPPHFVPPTTGTNRRFVLTECGMPITFRVVSYLSFARVLNFRRLVMSGCKTSLRRVFLALALMLAIGAPAFAQGSIFTTLSGTVVDGEGLPIPGANVKVKNNGTG